MSQPDLLPYALRLPVALAEGVRRPERTRALLLDDMRRALADHFQLGMGAWLFEARLRQPENLALPHSFTFESYRAVAGLRPRLDWNDVAHVCGPALPRLEAIPEDARLFGAWEELETPTLDLLCYLTGELGLSVGVATAMVYQKRPDLVPVLDRPTRIAFGIPAPQPSRRALFRTALLRIRETAAQPENAVALDTTVAWLGRHPEVTRYLALTPLRVLQLAAMAAVEEARLVPTDDAEEETDEAGEGPRARPRLRPGLRPGARPGSGRRGRARQAADAGSAADPSGDDE